MSEKIDYIISIKGELPDQVISKFSQLENFKSGFGQVRFKADQIGLNEFVDFCSKQESFRIIGVSDLSETLVEIQAKQNLKGEILSIYVFEVHSPSRKYTINFDEANFLLKMNDRTNFQSRFPDPFRANVKVEDFNQIVKLKSK